MTTAVNNPRDQAGLNPLTRARGQTHRGRWIVADRVTREYLLARNSTRSSLATLPVE